MASSDAAQLRDDSRGGKVSRIRIGSFNVDVSQNMLEVGNVREVLRQTENIIITCVKDRALDVMNLCSLGGHGQGLDSCTPPIHPRTMNIFNIPWDSPGPFVSVDRNYLTAWAFHADASKPGALFALLDGCRSFALTSQTLEPEFIIRKFQNGDGVTLY